MKKRTILTVIVSILLLTIIFATVDYFRAKNNDAPIFAIRTVTYKDGGSRDYYGLGYKVIKCNTLNGDKTAHFGFYSLNINKVCNQDGPVKYNEDTSSN